MLNIALNAPGLSLVVEIAIRQLCEASWSWDHGEAQWRREPSFLIWLVTGGRASLKSSFGEHTVQRGDFFVMPSVGSEYHGRHDPETPLDVAWLFFRVINKRGRPLPVRSIEGIPFHTALTDVMFAEGLMERILESTGSIQEGWLRRLMDEVRRQSAVRGASPTERQIRELGRQIRANPGRYRGLEDMRANCNYSKDHLIRLFRHYHGVTPGEFLIRARTDTARNLLAISSLSVKQMAAQLGYADASAFSRQFKARVGLSPSTFRERN
jgi:AraC-like DNA-binding protein